MNFDEYQRQALKTDNTAANYDNAVRKDVVVALLGIAGELGTLATTYKKHLRDGKAYELHKEQVAEELGDLLWYAAVLAHKFDLNLAQIASENLEKIADRWAKGSEAAPANYDKDFPLAEQLPRRFDISFEAVDVNGRKKIAMRFEDGWLGDPLTDNADEPDGYSFHDAFHLAFASVLGWSPVIRKLMKRKRRSNSSYDENQDGGRALVIEEGIAALVFEYGKDHGDLEGVRAVDYELLRVIKGMARRLEVNGATTREWEEAIRAGWKAFRQLSAQGGGVVRCDLDARTLEVLTK